MGCRDARQFVRNLPRKRKYQPLGLLNKTIALMVAQSQGHVPANVGDDDMSTRKQAAAMWTSQADDWARQSRNWNKVARTWAGSDQTADDVRRAARAKARDAKANEARCRTNARSWAS